MEIDLERSLRLLEDALSTPKSGVSKRLDKSLDLSSSFNLQKTRKGLEYDNHSLYEQSLSSSFHQQTSDDLRSTIDSLYFEFGVVLQNRMPGTDYLDVAEELSRCCADTLKIIETKKAKSAVRQFPDEKWLEDERNTWRLLYVLYQDRLHQQYMKQDDDNINYFGNSEKLCIMSLYKKDNLVRESQLVVDWLERNALERDNPILQQTDWTYGWENTLHQLESPETIAIGSSTDIVPYLHPDVSHSIQLPLHHLDASNDKQLCHRLFMDIRCGNLEGAQELCINCGHPWRAVLLEGWKLYHNPNEENSSETMELATEYKYEDIEGNSNRDLWKLMALKFTKKTHLNIYERAAIAVLCGSLDTLLKVCNTWEDYLWAYMKTMIDIRVESEIRDKITRNYMPLPEEYWDQRMSLNEVFDCLESSPNSTIRQECKLPHHIIQKFIILEDIEKLVSLFNEWVDDTTTSTQFLRFLAHLILFLAHVGEGADTKICDKVIETYIKRLDEMQETHLISYYVSKLGPRKQVLIYAKHLEKIVDPNKRRQALQFGEDNGLDVYAITKQVVENIRNRPNELELPGNLNVKLSAQDEFKISALDWLLFYDIQRLEALIQSNSLLFIFLTLGKIDAAQLTLNKIPIDTIDKIREEADLNREAKQVINDHLCYKAYLVAHETFNDWFKQFESKPLPPADLPKNAQFTEKVAHQHRVSQYNAELERWKLTTTHSAKNVKTLLYNVLLFPGGWLIGAEDSDYLRSVYIPEVVLLLYSVLHKSGQYEESVQLADIIASEKYGIYKVYTPEKLGEILEKICESSISLMNAKKDPWGQEISA